MTQGYVGGEGRVSICPCSRRCSKGRWWGRKARIPRGAVMEREIPPRCLKPSARRRASKHQQHPHKFSKVRSIIRTRPLLTAALLALRRENDGHQQHLAKIATPKNLMMDSLVPLVPPVPSLMRNRPHRTQAQLLFDVGSHIIILVAHRESPACGHKQGTNRAII